MLITHVIGWDRQQARDRVAPVGDYYLSPPLTRSSQALKCALRSLTAAVRISPTPS